MTESKIMAAVLQELERNETIHPSYPKLSKIF